jgi:glutamyl-Q tRNA(Asp) synthetase
MFAQRCAQEEAGRFLLRIEDIDRARCRADFESAIIEDLTWLGALWDGEIRRQSEHMGQYAAALDELRGKGAIYPCFCSRKDIAEAASAPHGAPVHVYPGTCRNLPGELVAKRIARGDAHVWRLHSSLALDMAGAISFVDRDRGRIAVRADIAGDVVLARRDAPASYHLCVALDDAQQGVTLVTRGEDLFDATHVHRLLQAMLALPEPSYRHHRLLANERGERLSKRDGALSIRALRRLGRSPVEVRRMAGFPD